MENATEHVTATSQECKRALEAGKDQSLSCDSGAVLKVSMQKWKKRGESLRKDEKRGQQSACQIWIPSATGGKKRGS